MFQIISGTSKTVSGTQNLERNVPTTAHKNVPTNSVLLGTLFQLAFPVLWTLISQALDYKIKRSRATCFSWISYPYWPYQSHWFQRKIMGKYLEGQ